jgi:hypothetical protein
LVAQTTPHLLKRLHGLKFRFSIDEICYGFRLCQI